VVPEKSKTKRQKMPKAQSDEKKNRGKYFRKGLFIISAGE
jgi:hypothetical protein